MYATEGVWCPVASFEKYLQYLNPKKRVLISTTQERGELRSHSLVRQHGSWRALVGRHIEANIKGGKPVTYSYKPLHPSYNLTILDKSEFEARHVMTVSGHRNESSTRADSKTDQTANRRMWETLTAAGAGNSAPDEDSVRLENLTAENINLSTLLTLSQEEHVMRHLHFQTTHSQVSKNVAFYNCNVFFQLRLNIYWYFLSQPAFIQFFTYCLMLRLFVNRIMCRRFVNFYTFRNKLSVRITVVTMFFTFNV